MLRRGGPEIKRAFPGASIDAPKDHSYHSDLADPNDGHVAHAAVMGNATVIVTDDSRAGFPAAPAFVRRNIRTITAAQFVADIVAADSAAGIRALSAMSLRMTTPPRSPAEILDELEQRYAMTAAATVLRPLLSK